MNFPPSEDSLYMCFDAFCKKVLFCANYKLLRSDYRRKKQGCVFSDLEAGVLDQYYYAYDNYPALSFWININHMKIAIENEILYQALLLLSKKQLEIVVLSYFMDMTDKEIAEMICLPRSTVQYNRKAALRHIKKTMEMDVLSNEKVKKSK